MVMGPDCKICAYAVTQGTSVFKISSEGLLHLICSLMTSNGYESFFKSVSPLG